MPQWTVSGADKTTGKDTSLLIEAPSERLARELATQKGILVAEISPSDPDTVGHATLAYRSLSTPAEDPFRTLLTAAFLFKWIGISLLATAVFQVLAGGILIASRPNLDPAALTGPLLNSALQSTYTAAAGAACYLLTGISRMLHAHARKHLC